MPLYKKLFLFTGRRVIGFVLAGIALGISLFAVELAFAFSLQAFLLCLNIALPSSAALPDWAKNWPTSGVLGFILVVGFARALLNWAVIYTQGAAGEEFRFLQRTRILRWAFHSESVSSWEVMTLFEPRVGGGMAAVSAVHGLTVQLTCALMILWALFWISPVLTMAVLAVMALVFAPVRSIDKKIVEAATGQTQALGYTNHRLMMSLRNLLLIQIYGTQSLEERHTRESLADYRHHALRLFKVTGLKYAIPQFVGMFLICVLTLAANRHAHLSPVLLVTYFYLIVRMLGAVTGLNITISGIASSWPEASRLYEWWEKRSFDGPAAAGKRELVLAPRRGDAKPVGWRLDAVTFTYPDGGRPVLQDLSLSVHPGQVLAITGPSGSGKSTLLNVLLGGLVPERGQVEALLPGGLSLPLEAFRPELLPLIGYVGPESFMLEGTIRENLIYGLQRAPAQAEIESALAKAECAFVEDLAGGLSYRLTEQGQGLSAGQKQRLALARALLRQPKVIILDEATSNLDSDTEERLVDTLSRLKGEMTIVAATHRKALLRIADHRISLQ